MNQATNQSPLNLVKRLDHLLEPDGLITTYSQERCLVAWVLLTRLPEDDLNLVWHHHVCTLEKFAQALLLNEHNHPQDTQGLYWRLIAQVTSRLFDFPCTLGRTLWQVFSQHLQQEGSDALNNKESLLVYVDVLSCLESWMEQDAAAASSFNVMDTLWNHYYRIFKHQSSKQEENQAAGKDGIENFFGDAHNSIDNSGITDVQGYAKEEVQDWLVMIRTLESILNNNSEDKDNSLQRCIQSWHESILGLIQSHGTELLSYSCMESVLEFITQGSPEWYISLSIRLGWQEWFLTLVQSRIPYDAALKKLLTQTPNCVSQLNQMLLAHVVSPEDPSLRALAWQTCVALVDSCGWNWMFSAAAATTQHSNEGSHASSLGSPRILCTWMRLASGEWRIQLEAAAAGATSYDQNSSDRRHTSTNAWQQATALPIGHACAKLLLEVIGYCILLAEQVPPQPSVWSGDALLHLKHSLHTALWTTVEYLQLQQGQIVVTNRTSSRKNHEIPFAKIGMQLLGTMLTEVDIWDFHYQPQEQYQDDGGMGGSVESILRCLEMLLSNEEWAADCAVLLPGLVHILANAEGQSTRLDHLNSLWEPLVEYIQFYWQRDCVSFEERLDETLYWACSCTEMIVALQPTANTVHRRLALSIMEWIQSVVQEWEDPKRKHVTEHVGLQKVQSNLTLALGCYMSLSQHRDQPPREHESRVILRALQICEQRPSSSSLGQPRSTV